MFDRSPRRPSAAATVAAVAATLALVLAPAAGAPLPDAPAFVRSIGTVGSGPTQMSQPSGVAIGPDGTVYVADAGNHRIQRYDGSTGAHLGSFGAGGPEPSTLWFPYDVDVDEAGDVWVADTFNNRIKRFSPTGTWRQTIGGAGTAPGQLDKPMGLDVRPGRILVADTFNHRIQELTPTGGFVRTWGTTGTGAGQFNQPRDVDVNRQGEVFVADTNNGRVQVFSPTGTFLRSWDSAGANDLSTVEGLDVDGAGHVWVTDTDFHRVVRFGPDGDVLGIVGGPGPDPGDTNSPFGVEARGGRLFTASAADSWVVHHDLCPSMAFTDLPATNPFFDAVCWGSATELVNGYPDGTFKGTLPVSRQAAAAYLYRISESPLGPFPDPGFSDVGATHPFRTEIAWLAAEGITAGYDDGTFRPAAPVSRQAMAAYLYALAGSPPGPFPGGGFSDVDPGSPFALAIAWLASTGISTGYADGTFRPASPVSRQALIQFLAELDARQLHDAP